MSKRPTTIGVTYVCNNSGGDNVVVVVVDGIVDSTCSTRWSRSGGVQRSGSRVRGIFDIHETPVTTNHRTSKPDGTRLQNVTYKVVFIRPAR